MDNNITQASTYTQNPTLTEKPNEESKKISLIFIIVLLILSILSNFGIYIWKNSIVEQKEMLIEELGDELVRTKNELESLKNPPIPTYCENGEMYENTILKFKVCLRGNITKNTTQTYSEDNFFIGTPEAGNSIYIKSSTDFIENALHKYTKDVYVDAADRNYKVDGVAAIQVSGTVKPDRKRAITVFTKNAITYEISLDNAEDATYTENLENYKEFVESFKFLDIN